MAEIVKIKKDGVIQYPITKPECVIDENGKNVLQLIKENGGGSTPDLSEYLTKIEAEETYQPKGDYVEVERWTTTNMTMMDSINLNATELSQQQKSLTELSAEVSGLSERIDNLPTAESSVFIAVYGETTHAEVLAAFKEGKHCLCVRNSLIHNLVLVKETGDLLFTCVNQVYAYTLKLTMGNAWYPTIYTIEKESNKTKTISAESTDTQYPSAKAVYDAIQQSGGGASNEWKCVYDGRFDIGLNKLEFSTLADGTPLKANEVMVQVLMDAAGVLTQGYVVVHSTTNTTDCMYGAIHFGRADASESAPIMCQMNLKASPFYMVAEQYDLIKPLIAQGIALQGILGNKVPPQIYEDITYIRLISNTPISTVAPLIKIYAR